MKEWFIYPASFFNDKFHCIMEWELVTIVANSNSWKTTFAMDIIQANERLGKRWFYINLEFAIETMWQGRWLWLNWKTKEALTDLAPLTEEENARMQEYVKKKLSQFDYYNNANWIELEDLIKLIQLKQLEWYKLFVVDTFSRIHWNLDSWTARTSQNKCMEQLQSLAQQLWIAIIMLHHTNRTGTREWSQKIMDLSNVFIMIEKDEDGEEEQYRRYKLMKDKYVEDTEVESYYRWGLYINWDDYAKFHKYGEEYALKTNQILDTDIV